nr:hypothetical protein [Oscillospiraceae bacterium]
MNKWIRKISGVLIASMLSVCLNGKACAETQPAQPEQPPEIIETVPKNDTELVVAGGGGETGG